MTFSIMILSYGHLKTTTRSLLTRKLRGRIWFGCLSKILVNCLLKMQLRAGLFTVKLTLRQYSEANFLRLRSRGISFASTCKLVTGDVLNAPDTHHVL